MIPTEARDINRRGILIKDALSGRSDRRILKGTLVRVLDIKAGPFHGQAGPGSDKVLVEPADTDDYALWTAARNVELLDDGVRYGHTHGVVLPPAMSIQTHAKWFSPVESGGEVVHRGITHNGRFQGQSAQSYIDTLASNGPFVTLDFNREVHRNDFHDMQLRDAVMLRDLLDVAIRDAQEVQQ
ncbi:hypothetical protein [Kribbella italica]|uniref:Uncharacterized protein n=1 Tax=Kribbella italica TaxID=1540520 RepID=A0A7W9J0K8_9ACTN|nr:hypothetical protein [Kribbella italica]MBB5833452.1 hypothetical protein [Kribbella italica]